LVSEIGTPLEGLRSDNGYCQSEPLALDLTEPVVKWHWTSASEVFPTYSEVMHTPVAVPLFDTNGNGTIDSQDDIAIIFSTYLGRSYDTTGVLRAVSANTGETLWANTTNQVIGAGALAAADIDADGFVEIIAPAVGGGIYAFEHTGDVKWKSSELTHVRWGGAAIADIDSDGLVEIVAGNTIFNADGSVKAQASIALNGNGSGALPVIADLDLDGIQEIISGGLIFDSNMNLLSNLGEGFSAIGNFDDDDFPEIAVIRASTVNLYDHDYSLIWSEALHLGGKGGPPTIADTNGDGVLDIGVAGSFAYSVYSGSGGQRLTTPPT